MLTGYDQESYTVTGLEEYWNYSVTVTAKTLVGSKVSDVVTRRTLSAGTVMIFELCPLLLSDALFWKWQSPGLAVHNFTDLVSFIEMI